MSEKGLYQDKRYLSEQQYKDSSNLDARAALHRQFSTAKIEWHPWVFDQMSLQAGSRVLECGCGPGWLWRYNLEKIPPDCHITLTDLSPGMVAEAEAALAESSHHFSFEAVNVEELPFADEQFDLVIANHMLYHVPDRAKALREIRRVLKDNGLSPRRNGSRLLAATNGQKHMQEIKNYRAQLFSEQGNAPQSLSLSLPFRLENGRELLAPFFSKVELRQYEDSLQVTEAAPLVAYILSILNRNEVSDDTLHSLTNVLEQELLDNDSIHISKESCLFVAYP